MFLQRSSEIDVGLEGVRVTANLQQASVERIRSILGQFFRFFQGLRHDVLCEFASGALLVQDLIRWFPKIGDPSMVPYIVGSLL